MKKYGRYICGVLTIAALLGTNASGPVPVAWAAEQSGQDALRQDGQTGGEAREPDGGQNVGDDRNSGGQNTGNGQNMGDSQNTGNGQNSGNGQTMGDDQNPGSSQTTGDGQNTGNGQNTGDSQNAGNGQTTGDSQNTGDGQTTGDSQNSGGQNTGNSQNTGDSQNSGGQNTDNGQTTGDSQNSGGQNTDNGQNTGNSENSGDGQDSGDSENSGSSQTTGDSQNPDDGQPSGDIQAPDGGQAPEEGQNPEDGQESGDGSGEDGLAGKDDSRVFAEVDQETAEWIRTAGEALAQIAAERDIMALVYLSDEYPVRVSPSYESETAVTVLSGQTVNILDMAVDENMEVWHYVKLGYMGQEIYGYVPRTNLACSDERFLAWEETFGMNAAAYAVDGERAGYADIEQFPESYRPALLELKKKHPNWTFVVMNTTLDWRTTIDAELQGGKSLVYKTLPEWTKNGLYDTGTWYYASRAAVEVYMDPRNALTENAIFQFEQLTYNEQYHTLDAVAKFLKSTFMTDDGGKLAPGTNSTYAQLFWEIGREDGRKVSPFHLAARVLQEQGNGTSPLISGTYSGYEGYYNYFNVGATGQTDQQVITSGLKYARDHGWNSVDKALRGGADFISANYIKRAQDTLYLQKFNVNPKGTPNAYAPYTHQYMQNITAPTTEGLSIKRLYEGAGSLENTFVFKIPVFENMPASPCQAPTVSTEVVLALPEGYGDSVMWLDGVAYQGELRNGSLIVNAPDGNAKTAVVYKYDDKGVPVGMYVWSLSYNGTIYTATAEPGLQDLLTYHGFSIRVTGDTGIRFKTGISTELRAQLIKKGVNGYVLKEYGTLVMNNANMGQYPMIKGGAKVAGGISYGIDASGKKQDVVFEIMDGRYRFTSVLVKIPVEQYKTEFAFRGYAVLERNGTQVIVYGPPKARSIYDLAKVLLGNGTYEPGSESYVFLEKLVGDADALQSPAAAEEE